MSQTAEERARTSQFAEQAVELLSFTPNLRMEFSRFVRSYNAHFGRQLRVAHYGCVKVIELFQMIPDTVTVWFENNGERGVRLTLQPARAVMYQRLRSITPAPFKALSALYASRFGAPPLNDVLNVTTLKELVLAAGGSIEGGVVLMARAVPRLANAALAACAVLSADRSIARGSTEEYFVSTFRRLCNEEPDLRELASSGVVVICERHVKLTPLWRTIWRVTQILAEQATPVSAADVYQQYTKRYEPWFPYGSMCAESVFGLLRHYRALFTVHSTPMGSDGKWTIASGVAIPPPIRPQWQEEYFVQDTPPGQNDSGVFDPPRNNIWGSLSAIALPAATVPLTPENPRRSRLAVQFDALMTNPNTK